MMQKKRSLRKKVYAKSSIDTKEYSAIVYERKEKVLLFDKLKASGCSDELALEAIKIPRSTLYRWKKNYKKLGLMGLEKQSTAPNNLRKPEWSSSLERTVLHIRKENPLYGKNKIKVLLKRDWNITTSVSTVGRILSSLMKRNLIKSASYFYSGRRVKSRNFNGHAQRWKKDMKAKAPGEYIQIDHMSVSVIAGVQVKHFQAICPFTKFVVEEVYSTATSNNARRFLELVYQQMPFSVKSIQVDGGSEFRGEFEESCKELNIPLFVLPPRSPECNGNVERANGSAKFEFYHLYDGPPNLTHLRSALNQYVKKYNTFRPHQALQYLTPLEYYQKLEAKKSQMY